MKKIDKVCHEIPEKDTGNSIKIITSSDVKKKYELISELQNKGYADKEFVRWAAKKMCKDTKTGVAKAAMDLLSSCWNLDDYDFLLEIAENGTVGQSFFALYYLIVMLYELPLDDKQWEEDVFSVAGKRKEKKVVFMLQACHLVLYWDREDFLNLEKYLYDRSVDLRIWAVNILETAFDLMEEKDEEILWMQEILERKLLKGDKVRFVRILVDQAYSRLVREGLKQEYCRRDFVEEYSMYDELETKIQEKPSAETALQYAVLLYYYPFIDLKKAINVLWEHGKDDESCMILGSFYCCYYSFEGKPQENFFLGRLLRNINQADDRIQALIYMMVGVSEGLKGRREEALHFFEKALEKDNECVAVYREIDYFSLPYSKRAKEARKKANMMQRKISLTELEEMSLMERVRFPFFMEMEIRKNIKRPVGFAEEWK